MEYYQRIKALREDHDLNQAHFATINTGEKISGGVGTR